ncbi:uncharacterized protein KY384_000212 [Bacidia gigantensis]|uniref:uncharacterized protein n=1 Tax=Bacidia gigantensis TaxID=2732470 RepID=UPI001D0551A4|nr:uncharacterized protein KY384_000212 [Bacidia gigantensis]KAG8526219.1 hypothetical protein KY384_000212 [Bacidia gigantensis]
MFSEYASKFLAQSQSRISFGGQEEASRNPLQRRPAQGTSRFQSTRSYIQRPTPASPYQGGASLSQFPFASRANAPLFYSAHDQFKEEDDEEEHEREVAEYYALQRSRKQLGGSRLAESSEAEDGGSRGSGLDRSQDSRNMDGRQADTNEPGIRSSWRGDKSHNDLQGAAADESRQRRSNSLARIDSKSSSTSKGIMEDVGLESVARSTTNESDHADPPDYLAQEITPDDDLPSIQQFRKPPNARSAYLPTETDQEDMQQMSSPDSDTSSTPPVVSYPADLPPRHDVFWGTLYVISVAALFSSFALVWLHTSAPSLKKPLGDTIYSTLHASYHLLAIDTVVAVIVSLVWLSLLRSYVRPLVYTILVAVPIILFSFFLYPLISSFQGRYHGDSIQDKAMRGFSFIPGILALFWGFAVYKGRHSLSKAVGILEFSCRILAVNPGLLIVGFATLIGVTVWSWVWLGMFTRVFLGGHLSAGAKLYIIDAGTWWLGIFFVLVYLWTLGVMFGVQRATTAATVSQWYFHRLTAPAPRSKEVINAALNHATSTLFGTICLSTLLALVIRLPYLILPRRVLALAGLCSYTVLPSTIATLTNPLTLTYSAIHSQPLVTSSRALARLSFLAPSSKHPHSAQFHARNTPTQTPLHSYTLSLLLLRATRFITSLALGFGGWVSTARSLTLASANGGTTIKGSLYAYVVGLIAAAIGWGVLGAIDGVVAGVVDAVVVCWGSEVGRGQGVRYCREADELLGRDDGGDEESRGFLGRR